VITQFETPKSEKFIFGDIFNCDIFMIFLRYWKFACDPEFDVPQKQQYGMHHMHPRRVAIDF
jgi:hypothetical protein